MNKTPKSKIDGRTYAARQTKWERKVEKDWVANNNTVTRQESIMTESESDYNQRMDDREQDRYEQQEQ